jgi:hypothetical protein
MLDDRFWSKVNKTDSCWFWLASKRDGYGQYWHEGKNCSAHRLVYLLLVGEIPSGKEIDHICLNRNCVNPAHLEPVDHITNVERGFNYNNPNKYKKTFLLYIHNPLFKNERKKSAVVNKLLDDYYSKTTPPPVIKTKEDAERVVEEITYKKTGNWGA